MSSLDRRNFIKTTLAGGVAAAFAGPLNSISSFTGDVQQGLFPATVGLTTGDNRADMAFRALQPFAKQIKAAIGKKRIIVKPNNVSIDIPLACTHADSRSLITSNHTSSAGISTHS